MLVKGLYGGDNSMFDLIHNPLPFKSKFSAAIKFRNRISNTVKVKFQASLFYTAVQCLTVLLRI